MTDFNYDSHSSVRGFDFTKGKFHYLTIVLSNSAESGNVFLSNIETLQASIQTEFEKISNLEFRGVGCSMVRGDTDSLTLGISAGYYSTSANLTESEATSLRTASLTAVNNVSNLTVSEIRVETNLIQESTF